MESVGVCHCLMFSGTSSGRLARSYVLVDCCIKAIQYPLTRTWLSDLYSLSTSIENIAYFRSSLVKPLSWLRFVLTPTPNSYQTPVLHTIFLLASEHVRTPRNLVGGDRTLKGKRGKLQKNSIERGGNGEHLFSSTGAYMLVYERMMPERVEQTESITQAENPLHPYLEQIIQEEHSEDIKLVCDSMTQLYFLESISPSLFI